MLEQQGSLDLDERAIAVSQVSNVVIVGLRVVLDDEVPLANARRLFFILDNDVIVELAKVFRVLLGAKQNAAVPSGPTDELVSFKEATCVDCPEFSFVLAFDYFYPEKFCLFYF